jgi:hypothetical protein
MKLLKYQKDQIVRKFVAYTFEAKDKVLTETENKLAREAYEHFYDEPTRIRMNTLPAGWLQEISNIWINAGGYSVILHFPRDVYVRITHKREDQRRDLTDYDLINRIQIWAMATKTQKEEVSRLRSKLYSFLTNITTDTRLFAAMPEMKDILGKDFFGPQTTPVPCTALATTAQEILCTVAKARSEPRDGCCDGKLITN